MRAAFSRLGFMLSMFMFGLLPLVIQAYRDDSEVTSLHVHADGHQKRPTRMDRHDYGKQHMLKHSAPNVAQALPAQETKTVENFVNSYIPSKKPPPKTLIVLGCLGLIMLLLLVLSWFRKDSTRSQHLGGTHPSEIHTEKQGHPLGFGAVLVCTSTDHANVYADLGSEDITAKVEFGNKVSVVGAPKERGGHVTVPILEPKGVVHLSSFQVEPAQNIKNGTLLSCKSKKLVNVFREVDSNVVVGTVCNGEKVVASKPAGWCHGWTMVPIRPRGAVELEFFDVEDKVFEAEIKPEERETLAVWVKKEMEDDGEINAKLRELRVEKNKFLMDLYVRKQKLGNIMSEMMNHEAELEGKLKPSAQEIASKADKIMQDVDMAAQKSTLRCVAYTAPLITQSRRIYEAIDMHTNMAKQQTADIFLQESKKALINLQSVVGLRDMESINAETLDNISIPSVAALLASALAPGQLRFVYAMNMVLLIMSTIYMITDSIVLCLDSGKPCMNVPKPLPTGGTWKEQGKVWLENVDTNHVYLWFFIDCIVHFLCVCVRFPFVLRVRKMLTHLPRLPDSAMVADPIKCLSILYDFYMTTGSSALVELDYALDSNLLYVCNWSMFFDLCWLCVGTDFEMNTPWDQCPLAELCVLRVRVTLFLILFIFYFLQLVFFIIGQVSSSDRFAVAVINVAYKLDEAFALGIPVFTVVSHALLARGMSDMILIQIATQKTERDRLAKQKEKAVEKLAHIAGLVDMKEEAIKKLETEHQAVGGRFKGDEQMQEEYQQMHAQMKDKTVDLTKQLGARSVRASAEAEALLAKWEQGEGGELIAALGRGEFVVKAREMAAEMSTEDVLEAMTKILVDKKSEQMSQEAQASVAPANSTVPAATDADAAEFRQTEAEDGTTLPAAAAADGIV